MTKRLNGTCLHPLDQIKTERDWNPPNSLCLSPQVLPPFLGAERSVLQCDGLLWPGEYAQVSEKAALFCFSWLWLKESTENLQDRSNITNTWVNKAGSVIKKRSFSKPKTSFRGLKLHFKTRPLERPTHWRAALAGVSPRLSCKWTDEQHPLPHYCSSHETEGVVLDVAAPAAKAHKHSPIER